MMKLKKLKVILILVIVIIVVSIAIYFILGRKTEVEYVTAKVEQGSLIQTVNETGTVKAASEIDLNFLQSGKISKVLVATGNKVKKNQILAELDYNSLSIKKNEARANIDIAKANLAKILAGATREEIAVSEANVNQAKIAYDSAQNELVRIENSVNENITQAEKTLQDLELNTKNDITTYEQAVTTAHTDLNNAKSTYQRSIDNYKESALTTMDNKLTVANTALDNINTVLNDEDAKNLLSAKNFFYLTNTKSFYDSALILLDTAISSLAAAELSSNIDNINLAMDYALTALNEVFSALSYCYSALENSQTSSTFTQTELDTFKTNISTQQTAISTAISSVQTAEQNLADAILNYDTKVASAEESLAQAQASLDNAIRGARNALATAQVSGQQQITVAQSKVNTTLEAWQVAQAQLKELKAPANIHDLALVRAQVNQAQAALESVNNQIEDSLIKAPIDGTITKVNYEIGEQTSINEPVISMLGESNFEIEVDISEADIAKIKTNNPAEITLDAFGEDIKFSGQVYFIEPAETIIQDVIYYKVKINFNPGNEEVKSGMTANVIITTAQKDNVLIMPSRAVIEKNSGEKYTRVLVGAEIIEVSITVGLRGDEGMIEVLSGVKEAEEVVTFVKENK